MNGGRVLAAVLILVLAVVALHPPPADAVTWTCDSGGGGVRYAPGSAYEASLRRVADALPTNASTSANLFATAAVAAGPNQTVYAAGLCRGDLVPDTCLVCLRSSFSDAQLQCPLDTDVSMNYDSCHMRFAGVDFLASTNNSVQLPYFSNFPAVAASAAGRFNGLVAELLAATAGYAAGSGRRFATGEMDVDSGYSQGQFSNIFATAQCTPDLTPAQCRDCLGNLVAVVTTQFLKRRAPGTSAFVVWCSLRYSGVSPVFEGWAMLQLAAPPEPPPEATLAPPASESGAGTKRSRAGISAGISCSVVLMLILSVFFFIRFRRRIKAAQSDHPLKKIGRAHCTIFDMPTLQEATECFSEKNKIGEGRFGNVYKVNNRAKGRCKDIDAHLTFSEGVKDDLFQGILSDGQEIAVKTLLLGGNGHALHQLHNELMILAELQHKNLVRLQGFCSHQNDTQLVYEYVKNGSLDNILFDDSKGNALNWEQQYNIIHGIAKGILYLHEDSSMRIIHRDLKTSNILLDDNMEPKIADFGLARLLLEGHTHTQTARVVGTLGYMSPEYAWHGSVSPKIDIFSFGVLVHEIVTRRSNCSSDDHSTVNLLTDVWDHWTKRTVSQMLHPSLDEFARSQALRCIHIGLLCVQPEPDDRPDMSAVVFMLTRDSMELQLPSQPAFIFGTESPPASLANGYDRSDFVLQKGMSVNGITLSEPYPR